ncbi:TolC family protein [Brevibacillus parabrevis]|uniref:TolC family protein n=1 Tax=Brevibacillus parabrevis TaxID=54914 RepID=UPI0028D099AF|nr:TolC family protein [Brevibacillus parabrevis]MED1721209.1 TolC family protein [Brevibacillus parabrevis]
METRELSAPLVATALDESVLAKNEAAKQYQQALSDYTSQKAALNDLIDKEAELFESETKAADALYQYNLAVSALNQSVGF